jgi:hypothetical protein
MLLTTRKLHLQQQQWQWLLQHPQQPLLMHLKWLG